MPVSFILRLGFQYTQSTGLFSLCSIDGAGIFIGRGYSGYGEGLNKPEAEHLPAIGPIPAGIWRIGAPIEHQRLGSLVLPLLRSEIPYGRGGFFIHGDNRRADDSASRGCIVLPRPVRAFIANSGVNRLVVVPD